LCPSKDYFLNARHAYFLCEPEEGAEAKRAAESKKKGGSKFNKQKEKDKEVPKSVKVWKWLVNYFFLYLYSRLD
jgi:hypothetical protein